MNSYPRIVIEFCTRCKWNLRAAWYLQELLSTFGTDLGEVALKPSGDGQFIVTLVQSESDKPIVLWDRKEKGGFPDSKELKRLVRDQIQPDRNLGHVDRQKPTEGLLADQPATTTTCEDCA
ncbi:hypothetical protein TRVA0_001S05072 [Trichomonascus vanleenenianus]|uniref:SelT/SelW/SelH family protein n=1 Tax=Trichomonascus vanleenenianus TaxID=2268995 RepID=UPI003ECB0FE0